MAYKVNYHGYDVTCDTLADLRALVGDNGHKPTIVMQNSVQHPAAGQAPSDWVAFLTKLKPEQITLLKHVSNNETITRERLRQLMNIASPSQFAGVLISISKSAAGSGLKSPVETIDERENGNGPRTYQYRIRRAARAEIKEALAKF